MAITKLIEGDTLTVIERKMVVKKTQYKKHDLGNWQLPCGCIGPAVWMSDEQGFCDHCGRGWWLMGVKSNAYCIMLDGKPQGRPIHIGSYEPFKVA